MREREREGEVLCLRNTPSVLFQLKLFIIVKLLFLTLNI